MTARLGIRAAFWQTWHAHRLVLSSVIKVEPVFGLFKWQGEIGCGPRHFQQTGWRSSRRSPILRLPSRGRPSRAQGLIQIFLHEKILEGCGGLVLTDEIKVTIAAQACLLLLHRNTDIYPKLTTVLVYPSAYVARVRSSRSEAASPWKVRTLTSVNRGPTESSCCRGMRSVQGRQTFEDGRNLVLHEFAHQLDREDGAVDGTPLLDQRSQYLDWARVFTAEYERLNRDTWIGRPTVLDEYGTTNPAEFFAVATECFFEKPRVLEKRHPELYAELRSYYRQDPARLLPVDPPCSRSRTITPPGATE